MAGWMEPGPPIDWRNEHQPPDGRKITLLILADGWMDDRTDEPIVSPSISRGN